MTSEIIKSSETSATLAEVQLAEQYIFSAYAENTRRTYASMWKQFTLWCEERGMAPLPSSEATICAFISSLAGKKSRSTITVYLSAISTAHKMGKFENPCWSPIVKAVLKGIARVHGSAQHPKNALSIEELRNIVSSETEDKIGARNRAMILVGFFGALRRAELTAIRWSDVVRRPGGLEITIRKSKTDKEGRGDTVAVSRQEDPLLCPVRALAEHEKQNRRGEFVFNRMDAGGKNAKKIALEAGWVAKVIKRGADRNDMDTDNVSGHSMRSGFATSAIEGGKRPDKVKDHLRHKTFRMTEKYIRKVDKWKDNPGSGLGG